MPFRVRNTFYLRISASDVIPLYVYLDERHVDWMSERILKSVVSDLRPLSEHARPKLEAERYAHYGPGGPVTAKKGTVEVHRSDTYQFAYFLRKADPHAIVLKTRNYTLVNKPAQPNSVPPDRPYGKRKHSGSTSEVQIGNPAKGAKRPRKRTTVPTQRKSKNKRGKGMAKAIDVIDDSEEEAEESPSPDFDDDLEANGLDSIAPRRSTRNKKLTTAYRDNFDHDDGADDNNILSEDMDTQAEEEQGVQVKQEVTDLDAALRNGDDDTIEEELEPEPALPPSFGMVEDEEETKSKPELQLSFRGLNMRDRCLCVVVEPWPALPARATPFPNNAASSRAASLSPSVQRTAPSRAPSIVTSHFASESEIEKGRGQTPLPLFLPDPSGRDRSATPAPMRFPSVFSSLETMYDTQDSIGDDDDFGMLAFSQVLNNVSGDRVGAAEEDDDEMDGGALYGDADEMRGVT